MRTYCECVPCFLSQALEAVRFVTDDEAVHEKVLRGVLRMVSNMDLDKPPIAMGQHVHRLIRGLADDDDPYREVKDRFNRAALCLYPELKQRVERSPDPLETAVRLAIAGNIIDFGMNRNLQESDVHAAIEQAMEAPIDQDTIGTFRKAMSDASSILYLGDNTGEIVFDRLLVEQMPLEKVTFVVRGSPVINDATMDDARAAGLTEIVEVIDNGSDAPGTLLESCPEAFRKRFEAADLILSKGQGNYETVSHIPKNIFFLLKAKCPVIARDLGCEVGTMLFRRK